MDLTVCIPSFGPPSWAQQALRAIHSAEAEGVPVIHRHGLSLSHARNEALALVQTEWVIFLDADDELAPDYCEVLSQGVADIRVPSVSYVKNGRPHPAYVPKVPGHDHECHAGCMEHGNFAVIGSMARTALVREVGGFKNWPLYEDFDLWLRMVRAGATMETIPEAVYLAYWRADSRNRAPSMETKNAIHYAIAAGEEPEAVAAA